MDHEIERAHEARVPYLSPENPGTPEGRVVRLPAAGSLATSYATQGHTSLRHGRRAVLRGRLDATVATPTEFFGITKWMLSAWSPNGDPGALEENVARTEELLDELRSRGALIAEVLATTPPDRAWLEDTVVFAGLDVETVVRVAREHGQPALTAWRDTYLTVIPTGLVDDIEETTREAIVELRPQTCPMRVDDIEGARCAMHGGPYGSRAIHAAAIWSTHRQLLLTRLGCDPCAGGTEPTLGPLGSTVGPVMLGEIDIASRYGGYVWR